MMSLIDLDDDQRWVPTHVNITVLRARGLRTKGKHGSRYLYTIIQVGKEKFTTGLVEKAEVPEWKEECSFELLPGILEDGGRSAYPAGSGDLLLTVMHRVLIGLDVFLGQAVVPLDKIFQEGVCLRDEWLKLNSKVGRKEKERGNLQVTVQFTRNNMTASMFDLTMKDKPRSAFGKLKDRVTGRKRGDVESSSAILPGRYAALSGSMGQPFGEASEGGTESGDVEIAEEKRSKMKDFFKGKLHKSKDTRSCSSLASESSVSSMGDNPPPSLDLLADPPSSPIYSSKVLVDTQYGEIDLAKKVLTSQHTSKVLTHKRAFSDEASKITTAFPRTYPVMESLKGKTMTQSKSSLCINGSHVYDSEPSTPKGSGALTSKLVLLEKCSPLSRSLQNLAKRCEDKGPVSEGRRWSFDKTKREEKEELKEAEVSAPHIHMAQKGGSPVQAAVPTLSSAADPADKGKKLRKTFFSGGRSDSLPAKSEHSQASSAPEGRLRGWFGSSDSQNKPRLEVSPKVESCSDAPPPLPPRSPIPPQCTSPSASPPGHISPDNGAHNNLFTPSSSPPSTPISPSNPFLHRMQRNPFFEELIAEELRKSPPLVSSLSSPLSHYTTVHSPPCIPSPAHDAKPKRMASIRRERPRPVARQISLPAILPRPATPSSPSPSAPRSMSETGGEWDDSFDAFASSRLNSPKGTSQKLKKATPTPPHGSSNPPIYNNSINTIEEFTVCEMQPPPLPPRRQLRTPVNEIYLDSWLHRGQELAVQKEACLLSQTGMASLQHGREGERKRNTSSVSPDPQTSSETSNSLSIHSQLNSDITSPGLMTEEKLKKVKYEPLEDEPDCWKGMLFEQDLYGHPATGNYGEPKVNNKLLALTSEESTGNRITSKSATCSHPADLEGSKMLLDSEMTVDDLLSISTDALPKTNMKPQVITHTPLESTVSSSLIHPTQPTPPPLNNNMSYTLTLQDLNMNVNNSDFSFIDSDGSSPSELVDTLKGLKGLEGILPQPSEDSTIAMYSETILTLPEHMCSLKNTAVPHNSSFEVRVSSDNLSKDSLVCQDRGCELDMLTPHNNCIVNRRENTSLSDSQTSHQTESGQEDAEGFKRTQGAFDGNGNPQVKQVIPFKTESVVVSARLRPRGMTTRLNNGIPMNECKKEDNKFEQTPSPVQRPPEAKEEVFSCQPISLPVFSSLTLHKESNSLAESIKGDWTGDKGSNSKPLTSSKENSPLGQTEDMSFEDLHAKVAPNLRTPSKSKMCQSLQESKPSAATLCSGPTLSTGSDTEAKLHPTPVSCLSIQPMSMGINAGAGTTLTVTPNTSSSSSSTSASSTTAQPLVDVQHTLLPEETQPANNLPHQESSPHPVKPLTTTASQPEKKESRSVLEKLKSTIHPGRTAHQTVAEPEKSQEATVDSSAQYQHLTNMELISLLLQQEMDMQKQQAASEQQEVLLEKREAELKKVKIQVRDLEDYIDNLLLRIMEQTPTLLQVRSRHK
ncbi:mucin-2-like [Lampris incognitus]|uniref:mucin-2-like n=1 Tax=Lampris incognitus TaxID=2546036 RepID=UPI0024B4CC2C|nr:mucin-2-like [Lampris incognitus]